MPILGFLDHDLCDVFKANYDEIVPDFPAKI
jgi:hypothetical protein